VSQDWYYAAGGERHGPVSAPELKKLAGAGTLTPTDLVWKDGMADWVPARSIKGLFPATPANPAGPAARAPSKSGEQAAARPRPAAEEDDRPPVGRGAEEDDDRPSRRRRDDDDGDDRPSRSRRRDADDEEDDRPRTRGRDEDDDDRPQPRKGRRDEDDEDDDRPRSRRRPSDEDEDDRPRRKRKRKVKAEQSVFVGLALGIGVLAVLVSLIPCIGMFGAIPALIGLLMAVIGLVVAKKSEGRQSPALPVAGLSVCLVALLIAGGQFFWFRNTAKEIERDMKEAEAQFQKEQAERKKEVDKAATEVKAADPGSVLRVTPAQFYRAYEDDEDRADALYKNKVIEMTGVVDEVNFRGDTYTVFLRAGQPGDTVDCQFAKDPAVRARLGELKPGATVTIRGKCLGGGSTLEACVLVE
jgi:hypothetical protein